MTLIYIQKKPTIYYIKMKPLNTIWKLDKTCLNFDCNTNDILERSRRYKYNNMKNGHQWWPECATLAVQRW